MKSSSRKYKNFDKIDIMDTFYEPLYLNYRENQIQVEKENV